MILSLSLLYLFTRFYNGNKEEWGIVRREDEKIHRVILNEVKNLKSVG